MASDSRPLEAEPVDEGFKLDSTVLGVAFVVAMLVAVGGWALLAERDDGESSVTYDTLLAFENYQATQTIGPDNEISLAVNPLDPLNLLAGSKDYFLGTERACDTYRVWSGILWSLDGGITWENSLYPGHGQENDSNPNNDLADYDCVSDPVTAFGPDGVAYYSGLAVDRGEDDPLIGETDTSSGIWVARSLDNGSTWSDPKWVYRFDSSVEFHDKQWFTVDPFTNYIYVTWSQFYWMGTYFKVEISFSRLTSWDGQFSQRVPLGDYASPSMNIQGSMPQVDSEGNVHVTWMDKSRNCLRYTRSDQQGDVDSWTVPDCVADAEPADRDAREYRTPPIAAMATDYTGGPYANYVYAVWEDQQWGEHDVAFVRSTDGGDTWSDPVSISPDGNQTEAWQFFGWLDVDPLGNVHLIYYTEQWALSENKSHLDVAYRTSTDAGESWTAPYRLTTESFDPALGYHQRGFPFIGDYINIDSACAPAPAEPAAAAAAAAAAEGQCTAYAAWADTRTGDSLVWTAAIPIPFPEGEIDEWGRLWVD